VWLDNFYTQRFANVRQVDRERVRKILIRDVFKGWILSGGHVLDIGAGSCEFINNIGLMTEFWVGKYVPGTDIPVNDKTRLFSEQPHWRSVSGSAGSWLVSWLPA
jgi:hypothetical protein